MFLTGGTSVLVGVTNMLPHLKLGSLMGEVVEKMQVWKLVSNHFFFTSPGELLFGLILLYYFRVFERQMGSAKFGAFAFLSLTIYTLLEVAYLTLFQPDSPFVSGPYGLIFAAFVLFYSFIPASSRFRFLGANLSDKFFVYILGLQLLFSHAPTSFVAGISGILSGLAYRSPALQLSSFQLPRFISSFCMAVLLPLLKSSDTRRVRPARRAPRQQGGGRQQQNFEDWGQGAAGGAYPAFGGGMMPNAAPAAAMPGAEPSEAAIQELTAMGFDRMMVIHALRAAQNDATVATNLLLNQYQ
jgi:hypothetical protein